MSFPNKLNYLSIRKVQYCPFYFTKYNLGILPDTTVRKIDNWIYRNLNNRYFIGKEINLDIHGVPVYNTIIGFEEDYELSLFLISYPQINT